MLVTASYIYSYAPWLLIQCTATYIYCVYPRINMKNNHLCFSRSSYIASYICEVAMYINQLAIVIFFIHNRILNHYS